MPWPTFLKLGPHIHTVCLSNNFPKRISSPYICATCFELTNSIVYSICDKTLLQMIFLLVLEESYCFMQYIVTLQQSLTGQWVNGEGLRFNSLDYLPVCYTQRSMLTVWYVGCYQSVTRNSNNTSGYLYNRAFITQPIPISHPGKFKFWIWQLDFFLKLMFLVVLSKRF